MKTIKVPSKEQVSLESQAIFEQIKKGIGKVPNLYAVMGYSANALKGFLAFEENLSHGVFTAKEREAIALAVSETNGCDYCVAAHTQIALKKGFALEETFLIRSGELIDPKLNAVILLAKSIAENSGSPKNELLQTFFSFNYKEGALVELIGLVTARIFTNYLFAATNIPIDFPLAQALNSAEKY